MRLLCITAVFAGALSASMTGRTAQSRALDLVLPTDNDALFSGDGPAFYQHIERDFNGVKSTPWEGGQYGFVRDPKDVASGVVYTRFHEGIDIRPVHRDANGEPLPATQIMGNTSSSSIAGTDRITTVSTDTSARSLCNPARQ
jgi:hypothetical protein